MLMESLMRLIKAILIDNFDWMLGVLAGPPVWYAQAIGDAGNVIGYAYMLDSWVPVSLTLLVATLVMATFVISIGIKLARTVISYLTFGGGVTS